MSTVRRRVVVTGLVQMVGYRYCLRGEAVTAGLAGWVANRDDGAVEAVLEGEPAAVEAVIAWMRRGPAHARVEATTVSEEAPEGERGFRVR